MDGERKPALTPYQLAAMLVGAAVGAGVLAFPRIVVEQADTGAPLATLLGALPALLAWRAGVWLLVRSGGLTPAEYAPRLITRPLGVAYVLATASALLLFTGLAAREFGEILRTAVLPHTPLEVTVAALLALVAYLARFGSQVFARVFEVFLPLMMVPLAVIALFSFTNARLLYLLPVGGSGWPGLARGALLASLGYVAQAVGLYLLPHLNRPDRAWAAGAWGIGLSLAVYLLVSVACLAVFGPMEIRLLLWPTLELAKITTVPGFILERIDAAFIALWVAAVFTTVAATYYAALLALGRTLGLADHRLLAVALVPALYMAALAPADVQSLYQAITAAGLVAAALIYGGVALLALVAGLRRWEGERHGRAAR